MRYYETLYLVNPNLADEDYQEVVTKVNALIEKNKGVVIKTEEWGKKNLAYEVKKFDKGYYVLIQYCGDAPLTVELRREFKLDERILKFQTIKLRDSVDPDALKSEAEKAKEPVEEAAVDEAAAETGPEEGDKDGE